MSARGGSASRWERVSGAGTGPADSVDTDSGPSTVSTLGPSTIPDGGREVAAGGAVSLGSMSVDVIGRF